MTPVESMDTEEAKEYISKHKEGTFTLLDVRQPREYENDRIPILAKRRVMKTIGYNPIDSVCMIFRDKTEKKPKKGGNKNEQ